MIAAGQTAHDSAARVTFGDFVKNFGIELYKVHTIFQHAQEYKFITPGAKVKEWPKSENSGKKDSRRDSKANQYKQRPDNSAQKRERDHNEGNKHRERDGNRDHQSGDGRRDSSKPSPFVCHLCGKTHPEPLSLTDVESGNFRGCSYHSHPDRNMSKKAFADTETGKLFNKHDTSGTRPGLQHHLVVRNGKIVDNPNSKKNENPHEKSNTDKKVRKKTFDDEINNLLSFINEPLPKRTKIGTLRGTKIKTVETEPQAEPKEKEEKYNTISCDEKFSFTEYLNTHYENINNFSLNNLSKNKELPIVEGRITRGKITQKFRVLIDSCTNQTYVSPTLVKDLRVRPTNHQPVKIRLGEGTIVTSAQSVSLKDLFLYQFTINKMDTTDNNDQSHEPANKNIDMPVNPFEELVADKNTAPCDPLIYACSSLPYGPLLPPVRRQQRRQTKAQQRRINAPKEDNIVGVGPVDVGATILDGIETSGYDIIIGIRDIRRLKLTQIFESLFLDEEVVPLRVDESTVSANAALVPNPLEPKQVQNNNPSNSTNNILPGAINNISTSDIARRNEWTSANTITVPKAALLDPLPPDDDYIDEYMMDKSPWEDYFAQSQSKSDDNHDKTLDPIQMTLEEIKDKIKIEGTPEEQDILFKVFDKYLDRFTTTVGPNAALIKPLKITVDDKKWEEGTKVKYPRPQSAAKTYAVEKFLRQAIADGVIRPSNAPYFSQILLTPKKTPGDWRFCVDYRYLNSCTQAMRWPIPNIASLIERIGIRCNDRSAKLFATLDFTSGYHQAELEEGSRKYTAFIVAGGLYEWCRVPMGPKGSPSYFQSEIVNTVFKDQVQRTLEIYIDDLITWAKDTQELADRLDTIFTVMQKWNLTVNPSKCVFNVTSIEYVGHVITTDPVPTISFSDKKLISVGEFELPENQKKLKGFLGLASYFRLHVRDHTNLAKPLHDMLLNYKPRPRIQWTPEQVVHFQVNFIF